MTSTRSTSAGGAIRVVHVVLPARNEAESLGGALAAIDVACRALARVRPQVSVDVTVALDRCNDDSAAIVRSHPQAGWIEVGAGNVGRARAVGVAWALAGSQVGNEQTWIANTDADSRVPPDWLTTHVGFAQRGFDLVLGLVRPVGRDLTEDLRRAWLARHDLRDGHGHVFGANLGVRALAYRAVRGFQAMNAHEDVDLADRVRRAGFAAVATGAGTVDTSARASSRTSHGFAAALHAPRTTVS